MKQMTQAQWYSFQRNPEPFIGALAFLETTPSIFRGGEVHPCIILGQGKGTSIRVWDRLASQLKCTPYDKIYLKELGDE